jgi:hypothetical protein
MPPQRAASIKKEQWFIIENFLKTLNEKKYEQEI